MAGENYNNADMPYTTRDLLLAGSHTTSAATQFALILLADNPVVQDRFQKDDSVVSKDRQPSLADKTEDGVRRGDHLGNDALEDARAGSAAALQPSGCRSWRILHPSGY